MANLKFSKETYLKWYADMLLWRKFEDKTSALYIQQKIRGFLHLYNGQEAVLAGSIYAIDSKKDKGIEKNELDRNAMGGTELMKYALYDKLPKDLLDKFQIIPSRVRDIDPDRIPILWNHDLAGDPETMHLKDVKAEDLKFRKLVFVSHWELQQFKNYLNIF